MALRPVVRKNIPDEVFDQLLDEVVDGDLSPGDSLPSERALAETLGVSRPAVREALQRMSQTRLVEVRHGGSTTVRDFTRFAGLDLLSRLLVRNGSLDTRVARSVVEARLAIGPVIAGFAAERHGPARGDALADAVRLVRAAPDARQAQVAALEFWDLLTDAADSIAFRLMFNSLRLAYEPAIEALTALMASEVENAAAYATLATVVTAGDAPAARAAAEELLRPATTALNSLLDDLEEQRR